ncbi:hypothetical protein AVEN_53973-1 [Araneus ventricosus]|uniref:Uncharacterized protein n=1 Tax=Araneus ventricosus TaxID=182803 RepID=A0A4Y2NRP6_ARAVE|nr:hypothetical protein AVEN_53973-1 [Araneus ventricosus]
MDNLNIEEATTKELMIILRKIINGVTIAISKEGITIFRLHLKKDLAAIANKLVVAIQRNQNISNSTVKEADSSSNTTVDLREIGIQCNSLPPDPSAPNKNAPTKDTGAQTIKSYLEAAKEGHKEQNALIVVPNDGAEGSNKDVEPILRKELPQETANKIKLVRETHKSEMAVECHKEEDVGTIKESIESINNNVSTRHPGKRHQSLVIYDFPEATTIKEIQKVTGGYSENCMSQRLRFKMRGREEGKNHIMLGAPSKVFHTLKHIKRISINWALYNIPEFYHMKKYATCQNIVRQH